MKTARAWLGSGLSLPRDVGERCVGGREGGTRGRVPVEEKYVDAGGVMTHMVCGAGQPLVIVHGGPGGSRDYFLPYLCPWLGRTG